MRPILAAAATGLQAFLFQAAFSGAHAASAAAHCTGMTVIDSVSSDADDKTSSSTWVNITDGARSFNMASAGCAVITFSGSAYVASPSADYWRLYVRTLLDGKSICMPATATDVFLAAANLGPATSSSMTRVCEHVSSGAHSVQVQYHADFGSPQVEINGHVLTVTHP